MLEWLFGEIFLRHILVSLAILAASIGVAWIFRVFLVKMAHRLAKKTTTNLDDAIIAALSKPIIAAIILVGVYLAALYLPVEPTPHLYISRGLFTILGLLGVYTGAALLDALIRWYEHETLDKRKEGALTTRFLTFFRIGIVLAA
ncbi:MAG: hypothetical protein HY665_04790, partial [Chloroflexi bacterium]|nr:hypothetical protein [Chloroflexota bacterium]